MRRPLLALVVVLGCAATVAAPALAPAKATAPKRVTVGNTLVRADQAADTLVSAVRWTLPGNDGKGPLDSLTVNVSDLARGGVIHSVLPAGAVAYTVRQALPYTDATWVVVAQVCTWRGTGANRVTCVTADAPPFVYALAAPPPVGALSVSNTRAP